MTMAMFCPPSQPVMRNDSWRLDYSSDSYMYNRGNVRQGFGGNYRRTDVSPTTTPTSVKYPQNSSSSNSRGSPKNSSVESPPADVFLASPFGRHQIESPDTRPRLDWEQPPLMAAQATPNHTRMPSDSYISASGQEFTPKRLSPLSLPPKEENTQQQSSGGDQKESPSVRAFVAHIEKKDRSNSVGDSKSHVTRTKVAELRETLLRRSNENLHDSSMKLSSNSRSPYQSEENLHNLSSSFERLNIAPEQRKDLYIRSGYGSQEPRVADAGSMDEVPVLTSTEQHQHQVPPMPNNSSPVNEHRRNSPPMYEVQALESNSRPVPQLPDDSRSGYTNNSGAITPPNNYNSDTAPPPSSPPADSPSNHHHQMVHHGRQKSLEEMEYEKQAALVASQLQGTDQELSKVIMPPPEHKKATDFMSGLFDTKVNIKRTPSLLKKYRDPAREKKRQERKMTIELKRQEFNSMPSANSAYWSPPSVANMQNKMRTESVSTDDLLKEMGGSTGSLDTQKKELIERLQKKLEILREEKELLDEEIQDNKELGREVTLVVETKCQNKQEMNKYKLYVDELDKVMYLLLQLSGRLARAENAVNSLSPDCSDKERDITVSKRDNLREKHEDAKVLKDGIDRRSNQVSGFLKNYLDAEEFSDYEHFIKMKSKLNMDRQEIEEKISLGEGQLEALQESINQQS